MLISEFARTAGLSVDTVRFYVERGLLHPSRGAVGASRSYHRFSPSDVSAARMIRLQQSLGYSLQEIAALNAEYRAGEVSPKRTAQVLRKQIERLAHKQADIAAALAFLEHKLAWVEAGKPGDAPQMADYDC